MNATRSVMWVLGIAFVLGGAYLLYFEGHFSRWFSIGVLTAGFLLFIGLAVMAFSGNASNDTKTVVREERVVAARPATLESDERRVR